jgi:hypothetical protein
MCHVPLPPGSVVPQIAQRPPCSANMASYRSGVMPYFFIRLRNACSRPGSRHASQRLGAFLLLEVKIRLWHPSVTQVAAKSNTRSRPVRWR